MKAAIALLASYEIQNYVRKIAFELNRQHGVPFLASLLPAHISLKQPFSFESMPILERYFDQLAESIEPFDVGLDQVYHTAWSGYGILGLSVKETGVLRNLHNRINAELSELFENTSAPHDGAGYHFHMTVELGRVQGEDVYQRFFEEMPEKSVSLSYKVTEIALFYYAGEADGAGSFITYKVLPLGGKG